MKKKLIEVALPLEAINQESTREKSIRKGHPSTLHLWWARRPLATARAVIWSSLVDDPSSNPECFPDEDSQRRERSRLFDILTRLVKWENSTDEALIAEAQAEILKSTGSNLPELLDPFAGGGAIPLEAQRLGLIAHAHDLNPVAVMINKAMIEIPPRFSGNKPVNVAYRNSLGSNVAPKGAIGLASDIRYYGEWMKQEVFKAIKHLYPEVELPSGKTAPVIAWIWARTVRCSNPACGCETPLAHTFDICKKKGKEYHISPEIYDRQVTYTIKRGLSKIDGTVNRKGGRCLFCNNPIGFPHIREEGKQGLLGKHLMAIVAEGEHGREYLPPNELHKHLNDIALPDDFPDALLPYNPRNFQTPIYGLTHYAQLFTPRQLHSLTAFTSHVSQVREKIEADAIKAGMDNDHISLVNGGKGALAYAEAVSVYLAFAIDKMVDYHSTICIWHTTGEKMANTMRRQAIQMTWDYAESNPMCQASGCFDNMLNWVVSCVEILPANVNCHVKQFDAHADCGLRNIMVSTDPPYYSNIIYGDVSDYFYIWMRQSLKSVYPQLFGTMRVPKDDELVASQYRHEGSIEAAKQFFETGMAETFVQVNKYVNDEIPLTVYYAYKQGDTDSDDEGNTAQANSGWETMLSALIQSGFVITGTWPVRTELTTALKGNCNALASSIVLVCRKRDEGARSVTRREFINALHREMRPALEKLQSANIAPVDLAQSAIGPGIGVFSRFKSVLEADGKPMTVRAALQIINQELDAFYNEQEGELDRESRFCVDLFNQYAFNNIKFGDADILARAKNTSVQALADRGVLSAAKGSVRLLTREEIPEKVNLREECIWLLTQQLARAMEKGGVKECAQIVVNILGSNAENAKALAYRLYTICERKKWAQEGFAYNNLVVAWPDIQSMAAAMQAETPVQIKLDI